MIGVDELAIAWLDDLQRREELLSIHLQLAIQQYRVSRQLGRSDPGLQFLAEFADQVLTIAGVDHIGLEAHVQLFQPRVPNRADRRRLERAST